MQFLCLWLIPLIYLCRYRNLVLMDATYKMCKLSLPLFFLVVQTNVGYAVIAKFIVQHEDTTSITEALLILRKCWDKEGINIRNFMIDFQQSEENVICAVFPDSIVYLCAFHRLQAWLQWIVNTKNGVSNYQTYCMGLLRAVGDAKTEDAYTKALMELQKSYVWSRFPNFRNYYTQQWAPKKVTRWSVVSWYMVINIVGRRTVVFSYFADVGSGIPCWAPTVRQHKQWDRGTE